ncbi:MAG: hypothetical protein R3C03_02050 [Pirellulaceae bacterium]
MSNQSPEPPLLDEALVQKLSELPNGIDGCEEANALKLVQEFNSLARAFLW